MLSRRDLDFLLHEWLDVQSLCDRARFASLRRDHFDAVLAQASQLARGCLAPANRQLDEQEPRLTAEDVWTPPVLSEVMAAVRDAGLLAVSQDRALGGMQLPVLIEKAVTAWLFAGSAAATAYLYPSQAGSRLLQRHAGRTDPCGRAACGIQDRAAGPR